MTILRTTILYIFIIRVQGDSQAVIPNLTLLSKVTQDNTIKFTCVVGENMNDSAVTFITPLGEKYTKNNQVSMSKYLSAQDSPKTYDCDFEPGSPCVTKWTQNGPVVVSSVSETSSIHDLELIIDKRWETFDTSFREFGNVQRHKFEQDVHNIGISVRTSGEANVLLCEDKDTSGCYWIKLPLKQENTIKLFSCFNINTKRPVQNYNCNQLTFAKGTSGSESNWTHFKLIMKPEYGKTDFKITGLKNTNILLKHSIPRVLNIRQILLFNEYDNKGLWKIHHYNYLSLPVYFTNYNTLQQIGPEVPVDKSGTLCMEFHVAMCPTCMLKFGLSQTLKTEEIYGRNIIQRWHLVRMKEHSLPQGVSYHLQVVAVGDSKGYWLIDDVQLCHEDETRIISIETSMSDKDIISCQTLTQPNWWSSIKAGKINQPNLSVCNNETYTGKSCAISCTAALGTDCSNVMVCEPSMSRMEPVCTCAAGYHGDQCQDSCPQGYYGSGCTRQCESCEGRCLPTSGACSKCSPGDTAPECVIGMNDQQTQDDFNPAVYALLLLLLIVPVVVWFIYRKCKRSKNAVPNIVVAYSAVPTEPTVAINNGSTQIYPKPIPTIPNNLLIAKNNNRASNVTPNFILTNEIKDQKQTYSKIIKINHFSNYVKESLENDELEKEFKLLPEGGNKPWIVGTSEENNIKNRYKNLTAYDHTRVVLDKLPGDPSSDFINANYIDGYKQNKAYIATQGPKKSTVDDFWRMIWQENISCIVMITNLVEEGKIKCEKYWPDIDQPQEYGLIHVTLTETDTYADFEYRTFKIKKDKTIRQVEQYHFTSWPDHGVPLYPQSLVPFLNRLLTVSPAKAPIVVHCSAGIGRTGTIILADICLRMAAEENQIDILKYFHIMREQRVNMIAKYDQYVLVHMVLLETLLTPETSYPCIELDKTVEEIIKKGEIEGLMQYLKDTAWHNQVMAVPDLDTNTKHASKNRFPDIVPIGRRMYLSKNSYEDESSDYINAVPVDGFRIKNQFIVTQNPLPNTIKDFWRLILEFNVKVIVSLNELTNTTSCKFWPSEKEEITPLTNLKVACKSKISENGYEIYKIKLEDSTDRGNNRIKSINIIHLKNWKYEQYTPVSEDQIVTLLDTAQKFPREDEPVVVTCYDGARACGLYVALSFIIEKIKLEHICDVCLAVRTVRNNREQFVNDKIQFEFLYKAAVRYISTFELYSNFIIPAKKYKE